jgi:ABC-type uncharacterized transport system substrate-binding protein
MIKYLARIRRWPSALLLAAALLFAAPMATAADMAGEPTAQRVRAAMGLNFLKFTEWPATVGQDLHLCIASGDPRLIAALDALAGRPVRDKRVLTSRFSRDASCDAIYVDSRQYWGEITAGRSFGRALTLGAYSGFARDGGMIEIIARDGGSRFEIYQADANRVGLRFHPELLRLAGATEPLVWIALSETGGANAEAAASAAAEIERLGVGRGNVVVRPWREFAVSASPTPHLIIAVGNQARQGIIASADKTPLLAVFAPRSGDESTLGNVRGRDYSEVLLEQPPGRQMAALRLALPERRRIGILFGPGSRRDEETYRQAAKAAGVELVIGRVDSADMLGRILQRTLEDSDVLLAVPDPLVFNGASLQNILTAAYRQRVPMVAFSPAYVRSGALLALYSTPAQVGRQAGEMVRNFLAGRPLPPPQPPQDFVISINADVAQALGLPLQAADALPVAQQLRAAERNL